MNHPGRALGELETGWVWLYTAGLPGEAASRRREEVAGDMYEHGRHAASQGEPLFRQAAYRFLLGAGSDVCWRVGLGRAGFARSEATDLGVALLVALGVLVALPVAVLFAWTDLTNLDNSPESFTLRFSYLLVVLIAFGGAAVLVADRSPVAGGVLGGLASICVALAVLTVWPVLPMAAAGCAVSIASVVSQRNSRTGPPSA